MSRNLIVHVNIVFHYGCFADEKVIPDSYVSTNPENPDEVVVVNDKRYIISHDGGTTIIESENLIAAVDVTVEYVERKEEESVLKIVPDTDLEDNTED